MRKGPQDAVLSSSDLQVDNYYTTKYNKTKNNLCSIRLNHNPCVLSNIS